MLRDKLVEKYVNFDREDFLVRAEEFVNKRGYDGIEPLICWLAEITVGKIVDCKSVLPFDDYLKNNSKISALLAAGDHYYTSLFRDNGYIAEHSKDKECIFVLTSIFRDIHGIISGMPTVFNDRLIIYIDLQKYVGSLFAATLARHIYFTEFGHWMAFEQLFRNDRYITANWIEYIPRDLLEAQLENITALDHGVCLADLATNLNLKDNDRDFIKYLARFREIPVEPTFDYLHKTVFINDDWYLKEEISFRLRLAKQIGIIHWLKIVDQLKFPFLQNITFYDVDRTEHYGTIVEILNDARNTWLTSQEHLIALTLNNFIKCAQRTSYDLNSYCSESRYFRASTKTELATMAKDDFAFWTDTTLPQTFIRIVKALFPKPDLASFRYFLLFFEWINQYRLEDRSRQMDIERNRLMKILRPLFQAKLNDSPESCYTWLNYASIESCNWNNLEMLVGCWEENKSLDLRDAIFDKYCTYLSSKSFSWNTINDYSIELINQAYHFSFLLSDYPDYEQRWLSLFSMYKVRYEGWLPNDGADFKKYRKECYILLVGIGFSYLLFHRNKLQAASSLLEKITDITLRQYRAQVDNRPDYLIPLKFITAIKAKFCKPDLSSLLFLFTAKVDDLNLLLSLWEEALLQTGTFYVTDDLKMHMKRRIDKEFYLLGAKLHHPHQQEELIRYTTMKDEIVQMIDK